MALPRLTQEGVKQHQREEVQRIVQPIPRPTEGTIRKIELSPEMVRARNLTERQRLDRAPELAKLVAEGTLSPSGEKLRGPTTRTGDRVRREWASLFGNNDFIRATNPNARRQFEADLITSPSPVYVDSVIRTYIDAFTNARVVSTTDFLLKLVSGEIVVKDE